VAFDRAVRWPAPHRFKVGQGTGLGLATVYGIVAQSHGYIFFCDERAGQGATFDLYFPRIVAKVALATLPAPRPPRESKTVLVVEDQDQLRGLVVAVLTRQGYRVHAAANGEDALRLAKTFSEPIQVLVSDVVMPGMPGPVLAEELRRLWPNLRALFMSGYTDHGDTIMLDDPRVSYIQKPFKSHALMKQLRELLDREAKKAKGSQAEG
jgi:CheY-like chemotaxis protein